MIPLQVKGIQSPNHLKGGIMASILRIRLINYMTLQRLSEKTKTAYVAAVAGLAKYHKKSPDKLNDEKIQIYLQHLIEERKLAWSSVNVHFSGIRYFYLNVLKWKETDFHIPRRPRKKQLPSIMPQEDAIRLVSSPENPKHRALLMTVYSAGLRVSEVVSLKPHHIESGRMMIRVDEGKGKKDRYTILSEKLLQELRNYYKACRPKEWLFFGRSKDAPMSISTAQRIYYKTKKNCGITQGRGIHTLRHCFATHMLEQGTDIYLIKRMMGHSSILTTYGYTHISNERIRSVKSPLDTL
jgi:integrase/recombinase XerD